MSTRLLQEPTEEQDRADYLEAFVHVPVYLAFRFQKSSVLAHDLARIMATIYDQQVDSDIPKGGMGKMAFFRGDLEHLETAPAARDRILPCATSRLDQ